MDGVVGEEEHVQVGFAEPAVPAGHGTLAPNHGWALVGKSRFGKSPELGREACLIAVPHAHVDHLGCRGLIYGQTLERSVWAVERVVLGATRLETHRSGVCHSEGRQLDDGLLHE
jgi:hypothetical protein